MTRKRPWNRVDLPVYSISSTDGNGQFNMNIITYVTGVSMQPKRFMCAVFENTLTLDQVQRHSHFVLQLLHSQQYRLVDLLGKKSGKNIDKIARLQKRNLLMQWKDFPVLKECLAVMEMKVIDVMKGGDHICFLCDVVASKNLQDGPPLTLDILRKKKLVRM